MAQETASAGVKDQHTQRDHIDDDEVSELQRPPSIYQKVREQAERFASTRLGQFVIERADRGLKLIEDTTKWSLPQDKNSSAVVLERPLPWAPFLLLIIALRLARIWVSLGALVIGNGPVSPSDMIYFIQTRRRKLRAIRVHGLRMMRHRQQESSSQTGRGYTQQLSQWLSRAICRPGVQRANSGRVFNVRPTDVQQQSPQLNQSVSKRPRDEDSNEVHNLTIDEMLAKYANENSEDDSDFVPNAEDERSTSSATSSSSGGSDSESHISEEISSNEERENVEQHTKSSKAKQNHVEKEQEPSAKAATVNGSNDKEQTDVAPQRTIVLQQEQWKSSPGPLSAALMNKRLCNNTAAAGSPNNYNSCFANQPLLRNATINSAPAHSTPTSELDEIHSAGSELEEAARQCISLARQVDQEETPPAAKPFKQQQQQQQQQQQRQLNHSHQRFRGRNRR